MVPFDFQAPGKTIFGWGRRLELGNLCARLGKRALLVQGSKTIENGPFGSALSESLTNSGIAVESIAQISREPTISDVDQAVARCRHLKAGVGDLLIGIGGGSALDLAKAIAGLIPQPGELSIREYLEGVGTGKSLTNNPLPLVAIPTTAGTGAEATRNAVISSDPGEGVPFKKSFRDDRLMPRLALIDPQLTVSNPTQITVGSGMDALTQLIESYVSRRRQPLTQALALAGIPQTIRALRQVCQNPEDREARETMAWAAYLSGLALANSGLGIAHGVAAALGILHSVPHGMACATLLVPALKWNFPAIKDDLARLDWEIHRAHPGNPTRFVEEVESIAQEIGVPQKLSALGILKEDLPGIVRSSHGNSRNGNPISIEDETLLHLLEEIL